jgi:hypothetical protein
VHPDADFVRGVGREDDARADQEQPATCLARAVGHVERDIADRALAPEELVQRAGDLVAGDAEWDVDAGRLDVRVDDAHPPARRSEQRRDVRGRVGLTCSTTKAVD